MLIIKKCITDNNIFSFYIVSHIFRTFNSNLLVITGHVSNERFLRHSSERIFNNRCIWITLRKYQFDKKKNRKRKIALIMILLCLPQIIILSSAKISIFVHLPKSHCVTVFKCTHVYTTVVCQICL